MIRQIVSPEHLSSMVWAMFYDDDKMKLFVMFADKEKVGNETIRKPGKSYKYTSVPMGYADVLEAEANKVEGSVGGLLSQLVTHQSVRDQFPYAELKTLPDFLQTEVDAYGSKGQETTKE